MNLKQKLSRITVKSNSKWLEKAESQQSKKWLREYSSEIARRVIFLLKERNMSQIDLAKALHVKAQRVNKIVKGKENMTLETIYKLSKELNFELISFPKYGWSYSEKQKIDYINFKLMIKSKPEVLDFEITNSFQSINDIKQKITLTKNYKESGWNTESPFIADIELISESSN